LIVLLLVAFGMAWALWPDQTLVFAAMTGLNLVIGRAAGMSFGYASGLGHPAVIATNVVVETLQVLLIYSLFALSWHHLLEIGALRTTMARLKQVAEANRDEVSRYGIPGLILFVFTPFSMTGPVVGAVIGFLIGLKPRTNLLVVLGSTYAAICVWALLLGEFTAWAATFNRYAPFGLILALALLVAVVGRLRAAWLARRARRHA
jgi:uncharacterized membrane protein